MDFLHWHYYDFTGDPSRGVCAIHVMDVNMNKTAMQKQTAVSAYLTSRQLLLVVYIYIRHYY